MRNYNKLALAGDPTTDAEFAEQYGLDPALIGTPMINDAMLDIVYEKNIEGGIQAGLSEQEAKAKAGAAKMRAKQEVVRLLREH